MHETLSKQKEDCSADSTFASRAEDMSLQDILDPQGGRRERTPKRCPVTSICAPPYTNLRSNVKRENIKEIDRWDFSQQTFHGEKYI